MSLWVACSGPIYPRLKIVASRVPWHLKPPKWCEYHWIPMICSCEALSTYLIALPTSRTASMASCWRKLWWRSLDIFLSDPKFILAAPCAAVSICDDDANPQLPTRRVEAELSRRAALTIKRWSYERTLRKSPRFWLYADLFGIAMLQLQPVQWSGTRVHPAGFSWYPLYWRFRMDRMRPHLGNAGSFRNFPRVRENLPCVASCHQKWFVNYVDQGAQEIGLLRSSWFVGQSWLLDLLACCFSKRITDETNFETCSSTPNVMSNIK